MPTNNTVYTKKVDSNNIYKDYTIDYFTHSALLENLSVEDEKTWPSSNGNVIQNKWSDFFSDDSKYYHSGKNINPNSIILSKVSDKNNNIFGYNNYTLYYNYNNGLKKMTSLINLDNGLCYDKESHKIFYNIDDNYIKEVNNKLYFNYKIFPTASNSIYGISKINSLWFDVNTGEIRIKDNILRSIRDIKNILYEKYKSLKGIYEYVQYIYNSSQLKNDFYEESSHSDENTIIKEINETQTINAYYFPEIKIYYKDKYWYNIFLHDYITNSDDPRYIKKEDLIRLIEIPHNNTIYVKTLNNIELVTVNTDKYYNSLPNLSLARNKHIDQIIDMNVVDKTIFKETVNKNLFTNTLSIANVQYVSLSNTSITNNLSGTNFYNNSNGGESIAGNKNQSAINNYNNLNTNNETSLYPEHNSNLAINGSININN